MLVVRLGYQQSNNQYGSECKLLNTFIATCPDRFFHHVSKHFCNSTFIIVESMLIYYLDWNARNDQDIIYETTPII